MLIYDGLAVIGACVSIAFCGWCVMIAHQNLQELEEVEHKPMPDVNDIPKWDKLNSVQQVANKELKKMYKGKMKGELV
jgi:hypothetical protein